MTIFGGGVPEGAEAAAWNGARVTFERFASYDKYLFSVPMWNAGIPYILKQFIDVVSQPGMVFGFDPVAGYTGLLRDKKAVPTPAQAAAVLPDAFVVGRAGFQLAGTWATPQLQSLAKFQWSMAKWPKGPVAQSTAAEGSAYAITEKSENADAAWIYLNEYISEAGQNFMWASTGRGSPSRSSAWKYYEESELAAPNAKQILPTLNEIGSADILYLPQTTKALDTASPIWDQVLAGKLSLEDGLNRIASELTPILAGNAQ